MCEVLFLKTELQRIVAIQSQQALKTPIVSVLKSNQNSFTINCTFTVQKSIIFSLTLKEREREKQTDRQTDRQSE